MSDLPVTFTSPEEQESALEYHVTCPEDGELVVGYEEFTTMEIQGAEDVCISFACPSCGAVLRVETTIPPMVNEMLRAVVRQRTEHIEGRRRRERERSMVARGIARSRKLGPEDEAKIEIFRQNLDGAEGLEALLSDGDA